MKFGVGVDYSLKALLHLAERYPSNIPIRVEEIAETQDIPENYLRRLLIELKRGGLVASQKGPSGGYMLAKPPSRITMADVVEIVEGDYVPVECLEENSANCPREQACAMRDVWREVRDTVNSILRTATLQSLADKRKHALSFNI
ncbi:MAG: Rrf2 family transcriptional regulator [Candidatus Binatus sp.]|uniref:RrF2 family transcriptional regulator n=1 Tax=Candidatus Binatus sp. TaxID=2811406 RepID=UPI00271698E2|nr:Rrf2 family transcriptional regulator [Candidatus Binatus sp.]MDO8432247.1 Rrf2 family transcriptional regulator [Candidatus Binatus sp.]